MFINYQDERANLKGERTQDECVIKANGPETCDKVVPKIKIQNESLH